MSTAFSKRQSLWVSRIQVENNDRFILFHFFNEKSLSKNDRLAQQKFLEIVPIFESQEEKKEFWEYAREHFWTVRKNYTKEMLPPFSISGNREQNIDILKEEYLDAMACVSMIAEFRKHDVRSKNMYCIKVTPEK